MTQGRNRWKLISLFHFLSVRPIWFSHLYTLHKLMFTMVNQECIVLNRLSQVLLFYRKTVQFSTENVRHIHWKLFDKWTKKVFDNKNFDRKCSTATLGVEHFPSLTLLFYNIFRHSTGGFIKYSMGFSIYWKNWLLNLLGHGLFSTFEHSDSSTLVDI